MKLKLNENGARELFEKTKTFHGEGMTQTVCHIINPDFLPLLKNVVLDRRCFQHFGIDERVAKIADHYGFDYQCDKLIEEMAELMVAIKHMLKKDENCIDYYENFVEELGDVKIIVSQLEYMLRKEGNGRQLDDSINFKLDRELKRMGRNVNA